jgi:hypothetical protein
MKKYIYDPWSSTNYKANILGMIAAPSKVYHGRNECFFYGRSGQEIKSWIRNTFGDTDDLVYTTGDIDGSNIREDCGALITDGQLTMTLLRWS